MRSSPTVETAPEIHKVSPVRNCYVFKLERKSELVMDHENDDTDDELACGYRRWQLPVALSAEESSVLRATC